MQEINTAVPGGTNLQAELMRVMEGQRILYNDWMAQAGDIHYQSSIIVEQLHNLDTAIEVPERCG